MSNPSNLATFAAGCFWCIEPEFVNVAGVSSVVSGYMGGHVVNPTYEQVCTGRTGHIEVVQVTFDPAQVSYEKLLEVFWRNVDPLDARGQFADKGSQYLGGIFTHDDAQKAAAEASKAKFAELLGKPIESFIRPAETFYVAEDYHQQYFRKQALRYSQYAAHNGRKERLQTVWGGKDMSLTTEPTKESV